MLEAIIIVCFLRCRFDASFIYAAADATPFRR